MRIRRSIIWGKALDAQETQRLCEGAGDAICLDLEDGVAKSRKQEARINAVKILKECNFHGKERVVRVNDFHSEEFLDDMNIAIAQGLPDAVRVPKCEYKEDMLAIDGILSAIEKNAGLPKNSIEVIALIESPIGIRNAYEIASSCERVTALNLGMEDMTRELGVQRRYENNKLDLIYLRQKIVLDAKAAGVQIIDAVLLQMAGGDEATEKDSYRSKQDGFTGRSCHGNKQAELANRIYGPDPAYVEWSRRAKEAYEANAKANLDMPMVDGKQICYAAYEKSCDTVAFAEQIAAMEGRK